MDELIKKIKNHLRANGIMNARCYKYSDHIFFKVIDDERFSVYLRVDTNNIIVITVCLKCIDKTTETQFYNDLDYGLEDNISFYAMPSDEFGKLNLNKISVLYRNVIKWSLLPQEDFIDEIYSMIKKSYVKAQEIESGEVTNMEHNEQKREITLEIKKTEYVEEISEEDKEALRRENIEEAREKVKNAKEFLESKMVGQDEYIKNVCYILMQILTGREVETSFFIGKSGSGKTYAWELLCKHDESPIKDILGYELIDASTLTAEGYKGCNLSQTLFNFDNKKNEKEFFVFIIDEFDKVLIKKEPRDFDMELQFNFLQILSHSTLKLESNKSIGNDVIEASFEGIPVVLLGSFQNYDFNHQTLKRKTIGFLKNDKCNDSEKKFNQSISEELLQMGAMPELIGRISHFHLLNVLSEDVLRNKLEEDMYEMASKIKEDYEVVVEINGDIPKRIKIEESFGARSIKNCLNKIFDASLMYDVSVEGEDVAISLDENNNIIHWEI